MQYFKDTETGAIYAYDDDVVVTKSDTGVYSFTTALGMEMNSLPTTLQPYTPVEPSADELLTEAKAAKAGSLKGSCAGDILLGFNATVDSVSIFYPSDLQSQANIANAALVGGPLWCSTDSGASWAFRTHTVADAATVHAALAGMIQTNQQKYATLLADVESATTVDAVNKIVWD